MKILMINTTYLEDNGISTFIINNCTLLADEGVNVSIVAPNNVNLGIKQELGNHGVKLYEIPLRFTHTIKYFLKLYKIIRKGQFDIVHVNGSSGSMLVEILAGYFAGIKVRIAHCHNTKTAHPILNGLMNPFLELFVTHRFACNNAAGKWLFGKRKFWVIKNGLDLEKYQYKNSFKNKDNKIILGNVGRFNFQKNQEFLISLIKKLDKNFILLLVGDGDNLNSLKQNVKKDNLENRVIFTGTVDNVCKYLNKMDLFLLPSRFEGQPYSVIEALASGLPTVISDRVSREICLVEEMKFLSIDNVNDWIINLKKIDYSSIRDEREVRSLDNIQILKAKGYDLNTNTNEMLRLYNAFLKNR